MLLISKSRATPGSPGNLFKSQRQEQGILPITPTGLLQPPSAQGKCWPWYTQRLEERNFISMMCGVQGMLMIFLLERQKKNENKKWNKIDLQQKCTLEWAWKSSCKPRHLSEPERAGKSGLESTDEHCMKLSVQAVWWRPNRFLSPL